MEKVIAKIAALGVPGLVFTVVLSSTAALTGLTGAALITASLAALGPGGIIGGIAFLGVAGLITDAITEYGADKVLSGVVKELYLKGESKESIKEKLKKYPVSKKLKLKLYNTVDNFKV